MLWMVTATISSKMRLQLELCVQQLGPQQCPCQQFYHLLLVLQSGVLESPLGHVNVRVPPPGSLPQLPVGEGESVPGLSRSRALGVRLLLVHQVQRTGDAQAGDDQVGWMVGML